MNNKEIVMEKIDSESFKWITVENSEQTFFNVTEIENLDLINNNSEIYINRFKLFNSILYLVNCIERDRYTIKTANINLSNVEILPNTKGNQVLTKNDYKLAYLVPIEKAQFVKRILERLFTRHNKNGSFETYVNSDITKLGIINNNYVILSYYKEEDKPFIKYKPSQLITYDASILEKDSSKLKIIDDRFNYIYDYLDLVYEFINLKEKKTISSNELKKLADYFAIIKVNNKEKVNVKLLRE